MNISKNSTRETDLAWIIHGFIIANGLTYIFDVKCGKQFFILLGTLMFSILDWHLFYKVDELLEEKLGKGYYPSLLWGIDYLILACYATLFKRIAIGEVTEKFMLIKKLGAFELGIIITLLSWCWWFFVDSKLSEIDRTKYSYTKFFVGLMFYIMLPAFIEAVKINFIISIAFIFTIIFTSYVIFNYISSFKDKKN